ncbi:hypothetical protein R3P38DRAFT_3424301 [Favolaschia claudopus]|uniref:Autophagy protein 5 n=1 Tax=Favolaschia claudopus TaxID=2862362 RepID=A0AAV9ZXU6_9AGAR
MMSSIFYVGMRTDGAISVSISGETMLPQQVSPQWKNSNVWKSLMHVEWHDVQAFQSAPRLKTFFFKSAADDVPQLPWPQIQLCRYLGRPDHDTLDLPLSILPLAAKASTFEMSMTLLKDYQPEESRRPGASSEVETFRLLLVANDPHGVGRLFDALTLLLLKTFDMSPFPASRDYPVFSCHKFLALAGSL